MSYKIAVVGATGNVGREILEILAERRFPAREVVALASRKSVGKEVSFGEVEILKVQALEDYDFSDTDIALFSPGSAVSKIHAPRAAAAGCVVIDNTSQFRMDPAIALVVPEVNAAALKDFRKTHIIANPNCSTMQMVVALKPLHDAAKIKRIVVSTYQSVSGAGKAGMDELFDQTKSLFMNAQKEPAKFTKRIAFNVIPHIDVFMDDGSTKEEWKMVNETKKILDSSIAVNATCVRVPVFVGHSESVNIEFERALGVDEAREILSDAEGVVLYDEAKDGGYCTPVECAGEDGVYVSRLRQDTTVKHGLSMWIVSDNLRKGAALNAVQIAEELIQNYGLAPKKRIDTAMKPLPKNYNHKEAERRWQENWAVSDVYHFRDDLPRERTFVIDTPPPTVSGVLHMGHIFSYTQADFVARYQRMSGKDVFYPMGFDDNGLPTERLVEKTKGVRGSAMPRADFVALCRDVVKEAEDEFRRLFKSTALSVDWRQEYQTISDEVRKLSQASFVDLLKKDKAYRKLQPMLWDPVDQTAIAQAEIEDKELPSQMNDIIFFLDSDQTPHQQIVIATTRPELLAACVAVFFHPDDERYRHLKGKTAITPLFGVKVPLLADENVKIDKGTGLVMCCTFGDETDIVWWRTHNLPTRVVLNKYGKLDFSAFPHEQSVQAPERLKGFIEALTGLKATNADPKHPGAREKTLLLLKEYEVLVKQTPITHAVKCAERSGAPLEILPTYQWFVKILDEKEALKAKAAECNWYPPYMKLRIDQWIDGLSWDWCISRQRFFGVPFPVWYIYDWKKSFEVGLEKAFIERIFVEFDELPIDPTQKLPKKFEGLRYKFYDETQWTAETKLLEDTETGQILRIIADTDVMDTWATSSISPQINAKSLLPNKLFPADLRPQAHEIIRTWAFYTIVKAHLHKNTIPWKNVMISGWCLAADKSKMSKSKGNVVTPVALIEEKGSDAVRYWASTSRLATDTAFSEDLLKIGRKLVTKLWNASNFASLNLSKLEGIPSSAVKDTQGGIITEALDIWILSRLHQCIKKATEEFERFEYCDARVAVEDFFWNDFCDNYLELVKGRAYGESAGSQQSALYAIHHCLDALLRLFAPFVPHVTEELYSHIFDGRGSVHARGQWPLAVDYPYDAQAELAGMAAVDILNVIRKAKSEAGLSIKFPVKLVEVQLKSEAVTWEQVEPVVNDLKAAGMADTVIAADNGEFTYLSDKGWFGVRVILAKIEEQKRNPDQKEHEKLEGKVVHGPGEPDLSKHVVKVQVKDLTTSLERQK